MSHQSQPLFSGRPYSSPVVWTMMRMVTEDEVAGRVISLPPLFSGRPYSSPVVWRMMRMVTEDEVAGRVISLSPCSLEGRTVPLSCGE